MFELIDNLEVFLNGECVSVLSEKKLKFYRVHRNHHHGDYTCIISKNLINTDMFSKVSMLSIKCNLKRLIFFLMISKYHKF